MFSLDPRIIRSLTTCSGIAATAPLRSPLLHACHIGVSASSSSESLLNRLINRDIQVGVNVSPYADIGFWRRRIDADEQPRRDLNRFRVTPSLCRGVPDYAHGFPHILS